MTSESSKISYDFDSKSHDSRIVFFRLKVLISWSPLRSFPYFLPPALSLSLSLNSSDPLIPFRWRLPPFLSQRLIYTSRSFSSILSHIHVIRSKPLRPSGNSSNFPRSSSSCFFLSVFSHKLDKSCQTECSISCAPVFLLISSLNPLQIECHLLSVPLRLTCSFSFLTINPARRIICEELRPGALASERLRKICSISRNCLRFLSEPTIIIIGLTADR